MISKVINIDCLQGLESLRDESVSVIVTSPPYNIGIKYNGSQDNKKDYAAWMHSVFIGCTRVLSDNGSFFLQMGGVASNPLIPWQVLSEALRAGFVLQNEILWVKNISIADRSYGQFKPLNSKRFLNHTHEFIFHLTKSGNVGLDRLAVGVPFEHVSNVKRFGHKNNLRCRGNVWFIPYDTINSKSDRFNHPATFPIALPEMCIRLSGVKDGSLVLDPFVGTGTTLVACKNLKMEGLGFDISKEYCEISRSRLGI